MNMQMKNFTKKILALLLIDVLMISVIAVTAPFSATVYGAELSNEQKQYIAEKKELKVAFSEHIALFCKEKDSDSYSGLTYELLQRLSDETGLKIKYIEAKSYREAVKMTEEGKTDITAITVEYPYTENTYSLTETEPYLKASMAIVRQKDTDLKKKTRYSVAEVDGYPVFSDNPMLIHTRFDSLSDCLQAVQGKQADVLYCNIYTAMSYVQQYRSRDLVAFPVNEQMWFSFGISEDDIMLKNLLNEAIENMTRQEINQILTRQVDQRGSGFNDFVYQHPFEVICFILVMAFSAALIVGLYSLIHSKQKISKHSYDESYRLLADAAGEAGFKYDYLSDTMLVFGTYAYKIAQPSEIKNFSAYLQNEERTLSLTKEQFDQMTIDGMMNKARDINLEYQMVDGTWRHFQVVFSVISTDAAYNRPIYMVGYLNDIEVEYREKERLLQIGFYDSLSGLYNRNGAENQIEKRVGSGESTKGDVILVMDVDDFKAVNDTYGHMCGDDVLKTIGQHLDNLFDAKDIICRWGGDEFLLYLINAESQLETIKKRCSTLAQVMKDYHYQEHHIPVTCSIGGTVLGHHTAEESFLIADKALYKVKQSGKGNIHIEDTENNEA